LTVWLSIPLLLRLPTGLRQHESDILQDLKQQVVDKAPEPPIDSLCATERTADAHRRSG
jgi:hypothetical protein